MSSFEPAIPLPLDGIAGFCRRWRISRLEVFGSILRNDFAPDSDVDFLATFEPDADWSLFDLVKAEEELAMIVGRRVELAERAGVERSENWIRRREILASAKQIYAA